MWLMVRLTFLKNGNECMRIGLASYEVKNKDVAFNLSQMERAMEKARGKVELLCFGEAFLQGFDALGDKDI